MKVTVYLPDDLGAAVQQHADLNVSAVAQKALREELVRRATLAELQAGMKRQEVNAQESHGSDVAFMGRELVWRARPTETTVFVTARGRIAIHDSDAQALHVFGSFEELRADPAWNVGDAELLAQIAAELDERYVVELDI